MRRSFSQRGFTLMEMALVIAIIGLLIGGAVLGRSLLTSGGLRSVISDISRYQGAIAAFQTKYEALPGDMANATSYWGADTATACSVNPLIPPEPTDRVPKTVTCDGDGNGKILSIEQYTAWVQLADAGLISGTYTGVAGSVGSLDPVIGENVPAGPITGTGFSFFYLGNGFDGSSGQFFSGDYGPGVLIFGKDSGTFSDGVSLISPLYAAALKAADAANVDTKLDDGLPGTGRIRTFVHSYAADCADSDIAGSAVYKLNDNNIGCALVINAAD
jgi:prepilin-type N-terminal cleavage/methylation domain-containing protein